MMCTFLFVLLLSVQINNISSTVQLGKLIPPPIPKCGENEIVGCWNECETQCPTYYHLNAPTPGNCTACMQGCICKPGYIRNSANGVCVGRDYCPIPDDACLTHEMFSVCGAGCQLTCMEPNPTRNCPRCVPGYVCIAGYVRNPITGLCVTINECPPALLNCIPNMNGDGGGGNGNGNSQILINMLRKTPKNNNDAK